MKSLVVVTTALLSIAFAAHANEAGGKKEHYKQAKEECLKDQPTIKGKALKTCINEKMKK